MTEGLPYQAADRNRPLITFAIFSYNQENFIRDAVCGALSQTHASLEIIVSDDCSTDGTFAVIQELAAAYHGPHHLIVRRNKNNLGIPAHINALASVASGEIIIMAAGDDISYPDRAEIVAAIFAHNKGIYAVHSEMETDRSILPPPHPQSVQIDIATKYMLAFEGGGIGAGATYAYRRDCFLWPKPLPNSLIWEDRILPFRAALKGVVAKIIYPMIYYREHENNISKEIVARRNFAETSREHVDFLIQEAQQLEKRGIRDKFVSWVLYLLIVARYSISRHMEPHKSNIFGRLLIKVIRIALLRSAGSKSEIVNIR